MHKYWARKPSNVVSEYIRYYSKEGDTVLDPFCGSGVTVNEALKLGRKAIGVDLDPISIFITKMTGKYLDLVKFANAFDFIEKEAKNQILKLYETECTKCKKVAYIQSIIIEKNKIKEIEFECNNCEIKKTKPFSDSDKKNFNKIEAMKIPYWYPDNELVWNTRVNVHKGTKVSDLFSKRNLIALSILLHTIKEIDDGNVRDFMKFVFSSTVTQGSKLLVHTPGQGPGWKVRGFWVPENRYEMNVWHFFENRYRKVVNGKKESNEIVGKKFKENETVWLYNQSCTDMSVIPDNSVDYIFTDPPYGDSVPYLELNYMWGSWQEFQVNFDDEIIISDSPVRTDKNEEMYSKMMSLAFRELYRVLKPERWLTVTFHNTDIQIYNTIIRCAVLAGFDLEKIVYQPAAKVSSKAKLAPYGSAVGDYYIRFKKPTFIKSNANSYQEIDKERYQRIVIESVKQILAERGQPTPYSIIINSYSTIYEKLKESGSIFHTPETIEDILKSRLGKDFVLVDNKWWFNDTELHHFDKVPLRERVERAVINVLNRKIKVSFDDILQEIFINFPNSLTPEVQDVHEVLENYAKKVQKGMWMLETSVKSRESEHNNLVRIMAEMGKKVGFKVHADLEGWRENTIFPENLPEDNLKRALEIDVIWYDNKNILYEFEVENSTGITDALERGSNIISKKIKRFIIIPEEREPLLIRKMNEPMFKDRVKSDNWNFIWYDEIKNFYLENKRKKSIEPTQIEKLARMPEDKPPRRQAKFDEFTK